VDSGSINEYFDKDMRKLAKLYDVRFYASGVDLTNGVRDICFDNKEGK